MNAYRQAMLTLDAIPLDLALIRRRRGLSLRAAAKEIGINFSTLDRIERNVAIGRSPAGAYGTRMEPVRAILAWLAVQHEPTDPDPFQPVFKGMFAAGFEAVDRMRGESIWRAEDAETEPRGASNE